MQRWIHEQGWTSLHDAQERAIGPILDNSRDVVIAADTATGKTEAAFLPLCSLLARDAEAPRDTMSSPHGAVPSTRLQGARGIALLYVSPLKALINDQYDRLELICERAGIVVNRWHGDVAASRKQRLLRDPTGVLLITPESLEAIFVNRGSSVAGFFGGLRAIVVDELHAFLSNPRGAQLQSLLNRIELVIRRRPPRIGLSATLGDMSAAARFLRPAASEAVVPILATAGGDELKLQLRGYRGIAPSVSDDSANGPGNRLAGEHEERGNDEDRFAVASHLFRCMRGTDNLVFANSRNEVEGYSDLLARMSQEANVPNEFWPHHGSLSKDVREVLEQQLKDRTLPVTAVCTSTLEMGIDIGSVASVAQIGIPPSVAALRQRAGRSGRRGRPRELRLYVVESALTERSSPLDDLRCRLVQTVATVRLFLKLWVEPPDAPGMNFSTLVQQIMSVIAQTGGAKAVELFRALCGPGPFDKVDARRFQVLLRAMASRDLLCQAADGTLLLGSLGERQVNHYDFYAAFATADEWRLVAGGKTLGTLPISHPLAIDSLLVFAGRRWRITSVDERLRLVTMTPARGGVVPHFSGGSLPVGDRVRREMRETFADESVPVWLDEGARGLLDEGRRAWKRLALDRVVGIDVGNGSFVFPWMGDRALTTVAHLFTTAGVNADAESVSIAFPNDRLRDVVAAAQVILNSAPPRDVELALNFKNPNPDKWDWVLDDELRAQATAARILDLSGAWSILNQIIEGRPHAYAIEHE